MKLTRIWHKLRGRSEFGANTALTAGTNVVLGALGIATAAMAARLLGPRGRGELAAIQTWPMLIGYLAMLGTDGAMVYYSAREPAYAGRYLGCAVVVSLVSCTPFVIGAYFAMPVLLSAQTFSIVTAARWYLMVVPLVALISLTLCVLRGQGDFMPWNALRLAAPLAWAIILIIAWAGAHRDPRLLTQDYLVASAATLVPIGLIVRRRVAGSFLPDRRHFKPMLTYGLPCVATSFPMVLNLRLDQMLMAALLSPRELGLYVVAVAWSGAINPLMNAIASVLFPKVAAHAEQSDRIRSFSQGGRLASLLALATAPAITVATPWGLTLLFGKNFQPAVPAALILVPAGAIAALNFVFEEGFRGLGRPVVALHAELAGLVTTAVGLYLLLRPLGILGASIASLFGYCTVMAVLLVYARVLTGESPTDLLLPSGTEVSVGMKRLALLLRRAVPVISRA